MSVDLNGEIAVLAAGYKKVSIDRGSSSGLMPRFTTLYEKWLIGEPGSSGFLFRAEGSDANQAQSVTNAVSALNAQRRLRYGPQMNSNSGKGSHGQGLTDDQE